MLEKNKKGTSKDNKSCGLISIPIMSRLQFDNTESSVPPKTR